MMTNTALPSTTLLRWMFQRGGHAMTCSVDMVGNGSAYDVCVLPHWDLSASLIARFDDAATAFERHAEISLFLRQSGWTVAQHSPRHAIAAA